jgi:ketosteroid isomerase-like protein
MSQENIDLIRSLLPSSDVDLASLFRDDAAFAQITKALESIIDPDVESVAVWQGGKARVFTGFEGFRRLWLDWLEPWASYHSEVEEIRHADNRVVVLIRDRARRHGTQAEVELLAGSVWQFRAGRIVRVEFFGNQNDALAAVGISR